MVRVRALSRCSARIVVVQQQEWQTNHFYSEAPHLAGA